MRLSAPPRRVGATGAHLQLTVSRPPNVARCIAFRMGEIEPELPDTENVNEDAALSGSEYEAAAVPERP